MRVLLWLNVFLLASFRLHSLLNSLLTARWPSFNLLSEYLGNLIVTSLLKMIEHCIVQLEEDTIVWFFGRDRDTLALHLVVLSLSAALRHVLLNHVVLLRLVSGRLRYTLAISTNALIDAV